MDEITDVVSLYTERLRQLDSRIAVHISVRSVILSIRINRQAIQAT